MKSLLVGVLVALAALAPVAQAQVEVVWDKSSIKLEGVCLADGSAEFTVTNVGQAMAGPSAWREYEADVLTTAGTFQLAADASQVWTFASNGVAVRFEADQRPGHPGSSAPVLTLTCFKPTAVSVSAFAATARSGCQLGYVVSRIKVTGSSWWAYNVATRRGGLATASGLSIIKYPVGMYAFACNNKVMLP